MLDVESDHLLLPGLKLCGSEPRIKHRLREGNKLYLEYSRDFFLHDLLVRVEGSISSKQSELLLGDLRARSGSCLHIRRRRDDQWFLRDLVYLEETGSHCINHDVVAHVEEVIVLKVRHGDVD